MDKNMIDELLVASEEFIYCARSIAAGKLASGRIVIARDAALSLVNKLHDYNAKQSVIAVKGQKA